MLFEARNVGGITYKEILHKEKREKRSEEKKKKRRELEKERGRRRRRKETDSLRNLQSLRYKQIRKNLQRLSP